MKRAINTLLVLAVATLSNVALAQASSHGTAPTATVVATSAALTEGEVRKVDKDAKKITIRHGAIANLDMPPMTMVFQVSDAEFLDRVKAGDKIRFAVEKREGAFTVTRIETAS